MSASTSPVTQWQRCADGGTDDLTLFGYSYAVGNGVTLMASIEDNDGNGRVGGIGVVNSAAVGGGVLVGAAFVAPPALFASIRLGVRQNSRVL
jgi:hypothetical protein